MTLLPRIALIALLMLHPGAALADAPSLDLGPGAVLGGERSLGLGSMEFASGGFDGTSVPMRAAEGRLEQRAWHLQGSKQETLALMQRLEAQLKGQGWTPVFACQTSACGGFDFRFALEVLPEPDMHVDLGDFRYLLAEDGKGGLVSLLVSRSLDRGFVQVASVTPGPALPEVVARPAVPEEGGEPVEAPVLPDVPPPPSDLAAALAARGAAVLEDLVFASGKAELAEGEYASLAALAAWLQANPAARVTLVGHTDATGSLAGNTALSRARAQAVRGWLVDRLGADGGRIEAQGAGYLAPRASNQTAEGRQRNRRVEVMVNADPGG